MENNVHRYIGLEDVGLVLMVERTYPHICISMKEGNSYHLPWNPSSCSCDQEPPQLLCKAYSSCTCFHKLEALTLSPLSSLPNSFFYQTTQIHLPHLKHTSLRETPQNPSTQNYQSFWWKTNKFIHQSERKRKTYMRINDEFLAWYFWIYRTMIK